MRKRPLMLMACVFLTGLVCQRYALISAAIPGCLLIVQELWIGRKTKRFKQAAGRSILLLSAFLIGILHMRQEMEFRNAYMSKISDGSRVAVWGELIKLETTEYGNRGILSDCYIDFGEGAIPCNDVMMYTSKNHFQTGQIHKIIGKVNMFLEARNEGNFNSLVYYQSLKIDFAVEEEENVLLQKEGSVLKKALFSLKENMSRVYKNCMSEKTAGFYQAMVLGDKTELDVVLKELFLLGGISHILAISGLHVSILGRGYYRLLRRGGIGFGTAGLCGVFLLVAYSFMVGNSASTVRAVGMMLFFFLSQWMGRSYDMLNALGGMVLFLLRENPFLIENSGFWFSVTALIGVGVVGKELSCRIEVESEKKGEKGKKWKYLGGSSLWMSLGIALTTLPVTALSYFEVPSYSVLVNFIVLPVLTPVFCLAVIGGVLGVMGLSQGMTTFLLVPCQWLLEFSEWVCEVVSNLPYTSIICGKPAYWQVTVYYLVLLGGGCVLSSLRKRRLFRNRQMVLGGMLLLSMICIFLPKSKSFEITFLDVGQGDGIYISAGDGTTYFIDGGSSNVNEVGTNRILPFLKSKQVASIDYWFVSHCDTDHMSGLLEILQKGYEVENIVLFGQHSEDGNYLELMKIAQKVETEVIYMKTGDKVCSRDLEIRCIAPDGMESDFIHDDANENSLVLQVEWKPRNAKGEFAALFAGDISIEMENALCKSGVLEDVDLVKANHHGSNYSNGELWFETIRPEYIVVSCSTKNLYGHPGEKAVARMQASGAEIFYTMDGGQITFPLIQ